MKELSIEIDGILHTLVAYPLKDGEKWVVNGTLTDIEFVEGFTLPACYAFGACFKADVVKKKVYEAAGVIFYDQWIFAKLSTIDRMKAVMDQLPPEVFVVVSNKSLKGFKHMKLLCPERQDGKAIQCFEVDVQ